MPLRLGVSHALIVQPGIHLGAARETPPRLEQPITQHAHLVLDLALLPTCGRRARRRFNQIVAAHLQKPAIERPIFAGGPAALNSGGSILDADHPLEGVKIARRYTGSGSFLAKQLASNCV
jgi:hypothetical protein